MSEANKGYYHSFHGYCLINYLDDIYFDFYYKIFHNKIKHNEILKKLEKYTIRPSQKFYNYILNHSYYYDMYGFDAENDEYSDNDSDGDSDSNSDISNDSDDSEEGDDESGQCTYYFWNYWYWCVAARFVVSTGHISPSCCCAC